MSLKLDYSKDILLQLPWKVENAANQGKQKVTIFYFALTTCVYCKKGIAWMQEKKATFNWLHLDELEMDTRQQIKEWLKKKYNTPPAFPFVIFRNPDKDYVSSGFDPDYWVSKVR
jgi:glutaredoxin